MRLHLAFENIVVITNTWHNITIAEILLLPLSFCHYHQRHLFSIPFISLHSRHLLCECDLFIGHHSFLSHNWQSPCRSLPSPPPSPLLLSRSLLSPSILCVKRMAPTRVWIMFSAPFLFRGPVASFWQTMLHSQERLRAPLSCWTFPRTAYLHVYCTSQYPVRFYHIYCVHVRSYASHAYTHAHTLWHSRLFTQ